MLLEVILIRVGKTLDQVSIKKKLIQMLLSWKNNLQDRFARNAKMTSFEVDVLFCTAKSDPTMI